MTGYESRHLLQSLGALEFLFSDEAGNSLSLSLMGGINRIFGQSGLVRFGSSRSYGFGR